MRRTAVLLLLLLSIAVSSTPQTANSYILPGYLYKVSFIQAAPGKLLELIDLQKARNARTDTGDEPALWMRHSQGDRWDLMLILPMGAFSQYYSRQRVEKRMLVESKDTTVQKFSDDIAWQEDLFAYG